MYTPEPSTTERPSRRRALAGKLAAVGLTGLLVGSAVAVGSMASADAPATTDQEQVAEPAPTDVEPGDEVTVDDGWAGVAELLEYTPEDEAVWERFDDCLTENGAPAGDEIELAESGEDAPEPAAVDVDSAAFDAAFDACEDILDDLSGDGFIEFGEGAPEPAPIDDIELSPEDEAVFERYEDCLVENGVPSLDEADESELESMTEEDWEAFDATWEAAAEACDPILTELSDDLLDDGDVMEAIELSSEDEAVFERFDQCLADNGVPMFDEGDGAAAEDIAEITEAEIEAYEEAYEAAAEACEPILDELSEDVVFGGLIEGCDEVELDDVEAGDEETDVDPADA